MDNRSEILGIPFGTAQHRLRKSVIFQLAKELNADVCYRCNNKILSIKEFSIDHMQSWENVSVDLFWNLENIRFSHMTCNRNASYHKAPKTKNNKDSSQRKSEFLKMSFGTAETRLRQIILFDLVSRAKKDTCYRCKRKIATSKELTIDHKQEWLPNSVELFWNLDNIAFSHRTCNSKNASNHSVINHTGCKDCGTTDEHRLVKSRRLCYDCRNKRQVIAQQKYRAKKLIAEPKQV